MRHLIARPSLAIDRKIVRPVELLEEIRYSITPTPEVRHSGKNKKSMLLYYLYVLHFQLNHQTPRLPNKEL